MEIKTKKEKILVIAIIMLVIVVIVLGGYICYDKILNKDTKNNTIKNSKADSTNINENLSLIKVINFNKNNCINNDFSDKNYIISRFGISQFINGLTFSIENDEKIVKAQVRYDMLFPDKYTKEDIISGKVKNYDDISLTFDKKVESIFGGLFAADGVDGIVFLFLLEDGTLEYMKYSDIYNFQKFQHKPISEVKDIVKFDNIVLSKNEDTYSKYTTIAYKMDGTYYDLSKFIE